MKDYNSAQEGWNAFIGNSGSDGPSIETIQEQQRDAEAENPTCDTCYEPLGDEDGPTCHSCDNDCTEDYPCQDCLETMADRAHDACDMER